MKKCKTEGCHRLIQPQLERCSMGCGWEDERTKEIEDFEIKRKAVIEYCYDNLDKIWAATVLGIILGCYYKDAKEHADYYFENEELKAHDKKDYETLTTR